jgi:large subunit ribosomal protein L6
MSRIGKKPIEIPAGVEVKINGQSLIAKGPKGELSILVRPEVKIEQKGNELVLSVNNAEANAFWGLTRALVANIIKGVTTGFQKQLEIVGVGFKAAMEGQDLVLTLGFSHPVKVKAPAGIKFSLEKNIITVEGFDKGLVGQIASDIRGAKPPEPYKGKGIRYVGEQVRKKEGKKAVATAG